MKRINFYIQVVWVCLIFLILSSAIFEQGILFLMLYVQFFLGVSQYLFSLIIVCTPSLRNTLGTIHFMMSTITVIGLFFFRDLMMEYEKLGLVIFFSIPWSLAILYWIVSFKMYYNEKARYSGRFRFLR